MREFQVTCIDALMSIWPGFGGIEHLNQGELSASIEILKENL